VAIVRVAATAASALCAVVVTAFASSLGIAATGPVTAFHSPDGSVQCADEPADALNLHRGVYCFSGHRARGCDGLVIALTGVGPRGRAFGVDRGCASGTPLDYGEEPVFKNLAVGQRIVLHGVTCQLRRHHLMRCHNQIGHGFLIGPTVVRRF